MNDTSLESIRKWLGTGSINIFGRPFAGKDTQGSKLVELFGATLLGGGDILRNSVIPPHVSEALSRGELIPSDDYVQIVLPYLSKDEFMHTPLILSSVGRWIGEEQGVLEALRSANHDMKAVLYLSLDESTVMERWQALGSHSNRGNRADDTEEILRKRLLEYKEKTMPVIDAYEKIGMLTRIDGSQTPDKVMEDILVSLAQKADA